jgi:hypothetical protein
VLRLMRIHQNKTRAVLVCAGLLLNKATVGQDVITEDDSRALSRRAT